MSATNDTAARVSMKYADKHRKVLAVDMHVDLLQGLEEEILKKFPECRLDVAATVEDARQLLLMGTYDVIITDIATLPASSLADLTVRRAIPVLVLYDTSTFPEALIQDKELKITDVLPKDDIATIVPVIKQVLQSEHVPDWKRDLKKTWIYEDLVHDG